MHYGYPKYVSVAEKRAKAQKKLNALKKKNPGIKPVVIEGRALATSWWGKSWNMNLERYADYANRIGRGRSYVRHGAVLDLQIISGKINAIVMGSTSSPYRVTITIKPVEKSRWQHIKALCKGKMESMKQLMAGKFPKTLASVLTSKSEGLFPSPKEILLECSCPDRAVMCKHVAAVLYGIGARLDQDPSLLFILRRANVKDLVTQAVKESKKELLQKSNQKSGKKSSRIIEDHSGLSNMFGIDLDETDNGSPKAKASKNQADRSGKQVRKSASKVASKKDKVKTQIRTQARDGAAVTDTGGAGTGHGKKTSRKITSAAGIEALFKRRTKSLTPVAEVIEKSDMDAQKVRNIIARMTSAGKLERVGRGVYRWAQI